MLELEAHRVHRLLDLHVFGRGDVEVDALRLGEGALACWRQGSVEAVHIGLLLGNGRVHDFVSGYAQRW